MCPRRLHRYADHRPGDSDRLFLALRRGASGDFQPLTENGVQHIRDRVATTKAMRA